MYLLGIDTTGKFGGVTLAEGDEHTYRELESSPIAGGIFRHNWFPPLRRCSISDNWAFMMLVELPLLPVQDHSPDCALGWSGQGSGRNQW